MFEFRVAEDKLPGKEIGSATATDVDSGDNARLSYSLPEDVEAFRINANTGKLYLKTPVDREEHPRFEFSVSVSDAGQQNSLFCCHYVFVTFTVTLESVAY